MYPNYVSFSEKKKYNWIARIMSAQALYDVKVSFLKKASFIEAL